MKTPTTLVLPKSDPKPFYMNMSKFPVQQLPYLSRKVAAEANWSSDGTSEKLVQFTAITNNLPYSCIAEIKRSKKTEAVHYAVIDRSEKKLIYRVLPENNILPSFSIHDLDTTDNEVRIVLFPVINGKEGTPEFSDYLSLKMIHHLGTYDLRVDLQGENLVLFNRIKPLIEKYYGKAALPGLVKLQQDTHDVYIPDHNTIHLSPNKNNFIHELIHACRKQLLFASDCFHFEETTELIEEFFAEGVANQIKDELAAEAKEVHGSILGYNYDFRIGDNALITQNVQSSMGGIRILENSRYFLASEAFHKIALEYQLLTGKYFGKDFNELFYKKIEEGVNRPDRELFFSLCEQLVSSVEGKPTRQWLTDQRVFFCTNVAEEKLFMAIRDYYTSDDWLGMGQIYFYETFTNGSDWIHGDKRYSKNGSTINLRIVRMFDGKEGYNGDHTISEFQNGFGSIQLYFPTKPETPVLKYFTDLDEADQKEYVTIPLEMGLYEVILSSGNQVKRYFRILGKGLWEHRNKLTFATPLHGLNTTVQVTHTNLKGKETVLEAYYFEKRLCFIEAPFIQDGNCEPGQLAITVDDGLFKNTLYRNVGYGGHHGGHQFWLGELTDLVRPPVV